MNLNATVECADGFRMSVQASKHHYCSPRTDDAVYHCVEVGFPSEHECELMPFAEEPDTPTDTVYSYVPATVIHSVIEKHGGMVKGELPPMKLVPVLVGVWSKGEEEE